MARYLGSDYNVRVKAYYKVAMEKRNNAEDVDEESFNATKNLFADDTEVEVVDNTMTGYTQDTHFTYADVCIDLRVDVRAEDYDEACEIASGVAESVDLPMGVKYVDSDVYDVDVVGDAVDYDWVVGA